MINMHLKYDNMHKNGIFYALNYINVHVIIIISCMLSSILELLHDTLSPSITVYI